MKRKIYSACFLAPLFLLYLPNANAQSLIVPQVADGGGWQTTLVLTNTSASATSASMTFYQETGGGNTQGWNVPLLETSAPQNISLPPAGTVFLHTAGTASSTSVGWVQVQASSAVSAYAIFTQRVSGRSDQDGTATAAAGSSRILIPYDNTSGFVTSVALANPTSFSDTITVGIQPSTGASSQPASITLPPFGHSAFAMPQRFSTTAGQRGLLELNAGSGSLSGLALRFNSTGGFTTVPAYPASGPSIIGSGSTGGGTLPQFSLITANLTLSTPYGGLTCGLQIIGGVGNYVGAQTGVCTFPLSATAPVSLFQAAFSNVTVSGQTFTLSGASGSMASSSTNLPSAITFGSVTLTLNPQTSPGLGTVTGNFTLTSDLATLSGSIAGNYTAN